MSFKALDSFDAQPSYQELKRIYATQAKRIVFFTGAGISALNDLPNWRGLRAALEDNFPATVAAIPRSKVKSDLTSKLDKVKKLPDPWDAFRLLKSLLGDGKYYDEVTRQLTVPDQAVHPTIRRLWRLNIDGIITLNLDNLHEAAHAMEKKALVPIATGRGLHGSAHVLQSRAQWLFHPHGRIDQRDTWIFSKEDLTQLLSTPEYRFAIETIFFQCSVVFLGITADDDAITFHLDNMLKSNVPINACFWLTSRTDKKVVTWGQRYNVRNIYYDQSEFSHHEAVEALLDGLEGAIYYYEPAPPVEPKVTARPIDRSPSELLQMTPEDARQHLNAFALDIMLMPSDESRDARYRRFREDFLPAINHAFLARPDSQYSRLFGYQLGGPALGRGAFAEVYRGTDADGETVAIKMAHSRVISDDEMLNSFRQGVASLKILSKAAIAGIVGFREAYEIPPVIVMEYIAGQSLQRIASLPEFDSFLHGLPILARAFKIVRDAHRLPETVIHRDIRPPNIMVRGFERGCFEPENVVVLDFDLSWHRGGIDLIAHEKMSLAVGYLAPEQFAKSSEERKSALVDVYGMGMTVYHCFTGNQPSQHEHDSSRWRRTLDELSRRGTGAWHCLGARVARTIERATAYDPGNRLPAAALEEELIALADCAKSARVTWPVIWGEELCARLFGRGNYKWNEVQFVGHCEVMPGFHVEVGFAGLSDGDGLSLRVRFRRIDVGNWNRRTIGEQLGKLEQRIKRESSQLGFTLETSAVRVAEIEIVVSTTMQKAEVDMRRRTDALAELKAIVGRDLS